MFGCLPRESEPGRFIAVAPVVVMATFAVAATFPVTVTEVGTLHEGTSLAPVGPLTEQVRLTVPEKPLPGTSVTVEFPTAPGVRVIALPVPTREMFGGAPA